MNPSFEYTEAFRRNLGFITSEEQDRLRKTHVAIAGAGGMGGAHLLALARLGIGRFNLADPDTYELSNFNRQLGARVGTIGKPKTEIGRETILSINPEAEVKLFKNGIDASSTDAFLDGVDVVLDGLDMNCIDERLLLFRKARERGIWVISAAPVGFGFTLLLFDPKGMTFEDYFGLKKEMQREEKMAAMMIGVSPTLLSVRYLDFKHVKLAQGQFPVVSPAIFLGAGAAAAEVVNLVLAKRKPKAVPWVHQFDAMRLTYRKKRYFFGMRTPWQRLKRRFLLNKIQSKIKAS